MDTLTDKQLITRLENDLINADANYSDLKEAYGNLKNEKEELTDQLDKEHRKYRDEINFGQRNQFKAHEEIEALEYKLAELKAAIRTYFCGSGKRDELLEALEELAEM